MKYILVLSFFVFSFSSVYAEDMLIIPQTIDEIKQTVQDKKTEFQIEIEKKQNEIKNQISKEFQRRPEVQIFTQEELLSNTNLIFEKIDAILVKFQGISNRIDARIQKLETSGIDMSKQRMLLALAQKNINESFILSLSIRLELEYSIKNSGISKEQVQKYVDECKESLKNTQKSLADTVFSLKIVGENAGENLIFE